MSFSRDYNEILNEVLDAYRNLAPIEQVDTERLKVERPEIYNQYLTQGQPDLSEGTILFIRSAVLSSMLWGLYKSNDSIANQIFPRTSTREFLERHASEYDIATAGKTDAQINSEIEEKKRHKRGGGNKYDYIAWAKETIIELPICNPLSSQVTSQGMSDFNAQISVDGSTDMSVKAWSTSSATAGSYILIELGVNIKRAYTKCKLIMVGDGSATIYDIKASNDGSNWIVATSGFSTAIAESQVSWQSIGTYRYWRLELSNTPGTGPYVLKMQWFEGPESITFASVFPLAQGEGTFDVVIVSSLARGMPSDEIQTAVKNHLQYWRTLGSGFTWGLRVCKPTIRYVDIIVLGTGILFDKAKTKDSILNFEQTLLPGSSLYLDQIRAIGVQNGADYITISNPVSDVVPVINPLTGQYEMIRFGTVTIS